MAFDEAEFSLEASSILQRHAAANATSGFEQTPSWLLFCLEIHKVTFDLLDNDNPSPWVVDLFAELGDHIVSKTGQYSDYYLGMILEPFYPVVTVARHGAGLPRSRYERLCGYLGVSSSHLAEAESSLLLRIADDEERSAQSGY